MDGRSSRSCRDLYLDGLAVGTIREGNVSASER